MRKTFAFMSLLALTACIGHDTPEALKAEGYHQKIFIERNYQDVYRCYKEAEHSRGQLIDGEIYAESGVAVVDYLLQLQSFGFGPVTSGWFARGEVRKIDDTHTQVDIWHNSQGALDDIVAVVHSCAQT